MWLFCLSLVWFSLLCCLGFCGYLVVEIVRIADGYFCLLVLLLVLLVTYSLF